MLNRNPLKLGYSDPVGRLDSILHSVAELHQKVTESSADPGYGFGRGSSGPAGGASKPKSRPAAPRKSK